MGHSVRIDGMCSKDKIARPGKGENSLAGNLWTRANNYLSRIRYITPAVQTRTVLPGERSASIERGARRVTGAYSMPACTAAAE